MNAFLLPTPIRSFLLAFMLLGVMPGSIWSQNASAYKNLATARDLAVSDTVSGQNMSIYAVSPQPQSGTVNIILLQTGGSGNPYVYAVKYTPDPGFTGVDTFTVEINYQGSYPYLIYRGYRVSVFPSLLTAKDDYSVTTVGVPVTANVLANDFSSGGPLSLTDIVQAKNGAAIITGGNSIKFTPAAGYVGMGYVNYVVCDSAGACKTAQYSIGVNNNTAPVADTLRVATAKNTALTMPLRYQGYTLFQAPSNGNVSLPNDHAFRYTPNQSFTGTDQFVLSTNAYGPQVLKTVILQILNTPSQNNMAMADTRYTPKNTPITFNVRQNDIGNLLVKSWVIPTNLKGTLSNTNGAGNVTFTPEAGYSGVTTFYYKIGNMFVPDLEMAAVTMVVGNLPPAAASYELTTPKETPMVVNYKIPFNGFTFSVTDTPEHGDISYYPGFSTQTINGQTVSGYNLMVYTPDNNFIGQDEFEINYCVISNNQCQSTKITMNVVPVFSAPGPYCVTNCVWTGDVNADGIVNNKDLLPLGYFMGLSGPTRNYASLEWYGQHSNNWNNPYLEKNADLKHADTDGSGQVDTQDTLAISLFYDQTHQLTPAIPPSSKGLPFFLNILTPNPGVGDLVEVEISLGSASQPVTNLYGFTFDASLSPLILDSALQIEYFNGSWLNANAADIWMSKNPRQGRLESAFSRTNGVAASGFGVVGTMSFIIIDVIDDSRPGGKDYFTLDFDASSIQWADGSITAGDRYSIEIPLRTQPSNRVSNQNFFIYPSPAKDWVNIHLNGDEFIETLQVYDLTGKLMYHSGSVNLEQSRINVANFPSGMYIATARTTNGQVTRKFSVLR